MPRLDRGRLHEVHAAAADWAAATAFALALRGLPQDGALFLIRMAGRQRQSPNLYGEGLIGLGVTTGEVVLVHAASETELLRAGLDAVRCPGIAAVVLETRGNLPGYDLTASRRLALAAERSRVAAVMLRGDARPRPSAAHTRWDVRSAPSAPLPGQAPGWPAIEASLLRRRGGPGGQRWRLEWDCDDECFRETLLTPGADSPALPGAVVPLAGLRTGAAGSEPRAA